MRSYQLTDQQKSALADKVIKAYETAPYTPLPNGVRPDYLALADTAVREVMELVDTQAVDPRLWEGPLSDPQNQVKKGDLVRMVVGSTIRDGVVDRKSAHGNWLAEDGALLMDGNRYTVYRIPAKTPPVEEYILALELGT